MEAKELLRIYREIEDRGWEVAGIYHSHPRSAPYPSPTDVELAFWPDALYLIISLAEAANPRVRAYRIVDGQIQEEELTAEL